LLRKENSVEDVRIDKEQIVVTLRSGETDYTHLPALLVGKGFHLLRFQEEELNLETAFMTLTKGVGAKI
jgi:ABC-2 type transport system ATP-binding protein